MEQLLEAISDAVSSMVLYSVEADESNAAIPNILPGAQGVKSTVDYLVDLARKSSELWKNFNQEEMKNKMNATCDLITESTTLLVESATILSNMPFNKPAKKSLLKGAKGIMEHMVVLLQQADLYEVTRTIKIARKTESKLKIFVGLEPGESFFAQAAQDLVTGMVELGKVVNKRVNEIDDYSYKRRFEEANTSLKVEIPIILQHFANYQKNPNDKFSFQEGHKVFKTLLNVIEEIVVVARLSSKSPFDLSMIQGLDLRDEDDLKDAGILIAHEREKLLSAIQAGDGAEAARALKAIKKSLNDQIVISKALAKSADPYQKKKLEDAASNAQNVLDTIIAQFGQAVEDLLANPDNKTLFERLKMNLGTIQDASNQMVNSAQRISSNDIANADKTLEDMIEIMRGNVVKSDTIELYRNIPELRERFVEVIVLTEGFTKTVDDAKTKAQIEKVLYQNRDRGEVIIGKLETQTGDLAKSPFNPKIQQDMHENLDQLQKCGRDLVQVTSLGSAEQLYKIHSTIDDDMRALKKAVMDGDKKETQKALRQVRAHLYDQLDMAKALSRTTQDQTVQQALESAILKVDEQLADLINDLYGASNKAVDDPSNPSAIQALDDVIASIDSLKGGITGAVSKELIANNTRELEAKLTQLVHSIKNSDQEQSIQTLKAIIEQVKNQASLAELASINIAEVDENRAARIKERAVDLTSTAPELVKAVKANLVELTPDNLQALGQSINLVRDNNRDLSNAILLSTEEELLENSSKIDQDMRKIQTLLAEGKPISMADVNSLMKKMNNQIRLANQHAQTLKDPQAKKQLLESTQQLNSMVNQLLEACKKHVANPNDVQARKEVQDLLRQAIKANIDLMGGSLSAADELVYGTPNLLKLIQRLEEAILNGNPDEIKMAFRELNEELTRQLFLARIAESEITDPERKKQLQDAILELETLQNNLFPSIMQLLANPDSKEAKEALYSLLGRLKSQVEKVNSIASTNPSEHLQSKSYTIAQELHRMEKAVKINNAQEANDSIQKALNGIKQQIQLSKHIAEHTDNLPQKRAINELSDKLEKQALVLQAAVKESLANPGNAAAKAKVQEASAQTRVLMAQLIAASSNKVPEEVIIQTAQNIKKELDQFSQVLQNGNSKQVKDAIDAHKYGEQQQKIELLKSFNDKVQDPFLKRDIAIAIQDLEKKLDQTNQFIETNPSIANQPDKLKQLKQHLDSSSHSANNVIVASTQSNDDRIMAQAVKIAESLDQVKKSSKSGNKQQTDNNLKQFKEEVTDVVQLIKTASESVRDQHKKVALNEVAEKLKALTQPISNTANNLAGKPSDQNLDRELNQLVNQAKDLLGKAVVSSSKDSSQPKDVLEKVLMKATNDIQRMNNSVQSNDQKALGEAVNSLKDTEKRISLLENHLPDVENRDQLVKGLESLSKNSLPSIIATGNNALMTGDTTVAKQSINGQSQNAIGDITKVVSLTNKTPEEKIIQNDKVVSNEINQLAVQIKNNPNDKKSTQTLIDTTVKSLNEESILANVLANHTSNPERKQKLQEQVKKLDQTVQQLAKGANQLDAKTLESKVNEAKSIHQTIVQEAQKEKDEKEAKAKKEKEEQERLERERLQREKEEREKAQQDEVLAAAQKIAERTKMLNQDKSTAEGKLYSTASDIGSILKNLSIAASSNDKVGMINCSKQLSEHVNTYLQQAKETAAKCTDPKLKEQIITAAQAAKNFTVQLKIIAAVKAASEDDDPSSNKAQLVKCAKGLAKAVVQTINAVEIGSIRAK
ncbi:putative actin binding protein [Tieghemostelium lacteum]|uniref:Putative actin binding protein n=1 Tax=Tieghemostelium lacteum TaxID=361077 RepID=A0A151ZKG4_TIELA|nr:putative actin binding protein [Tieghemostelium lacteum]|eukprot:KYQ94436.1 putative actin binding protein [Tieghemostelium lacteum]